ncbi:MAG: YwbE family protein [Patescibacteria group bacterium]|nr:YwbE family protein [Patescibacteria group bacterium]
MESDSTIRRNIRPGLVVVIVKKEDQKTGKMTQGIVRDILTNIAVHPRGIKVRLASGEVGRVQYIQSQ